ncbi:MAG: hypothetical protein AABY10_00835 [Nanoarchaeota archaeon]
MTKARGVIKCEGRFAELRNYLYSEVLPVVLGENTSIDKRQLRDVWSLVKGEVSLFDIRDPYYSNHRDKARKFTMLGSPYLIPLFEPTSYSIDKRLIEDYTRSMGNNRKVRKNLCALAEQPRRFLHDTLGREPRAVVFPESGGKTLAGYIVSGDFGVGTIAQGGIGGGGVRSDSPFLLEVYHSPGDHARGEINLAALIGFWAQDNDMLVSQMQSCRNAKLPNGVKFGVGCLHIAETVGRLMGFKNILTYTARHHPQFMEHPETWGQLAEDFTCIFDGSAKALGFEGSRCGDFYSKKLNK